MLISNLWGGFDYMGLQSYPVTYKMMSAVNGISAFFVLIILVFFSGELVWRDRDSHLHEVIDATSFCRTTGGSFHHPNRPWLSFSSLPR
jgi:ABC-2 type transport system permease protein